MTSFGDQLVSVLERTGGLLETHATDLTGTGYVSPPQPFGEVAQRLWHLRRRRFAGLHHLALLFAAGGPIEAIAARNGWSDEFRALQSDFRGAFEALNGIRFISRDPRDVPKPRP